MPEEPPPEGLASLSEALRDELRSSTPNHQRIRQLLQRSLAHDLPAPVRSRLLRTLAATYAALGDWSSACSAAERAFVEMSEREPADVELLIDATHTYVTILERAGRHGDALAAMKTALSMAVPIATPPQLAELMEMQATTYAAPIFPPSN